jgi:hypothetical protein
MGKAQKSKEARNKCGGQLDNMDFYGTLILDEMAWERHKNLRKLETNVVDNLIIWIFLVEKLPSLAPIGPPSHS